MASAVQHRLRGRPAHTPGSTYLTYTPDGSRLITAGSNNAIRVYKTGSDGEPVNIDDCQELNTAVAATNEFFIAGSEDGLVSVYSLLTGSLDKLLVRCSLPVRDVAISPDGNWAAVASDELVVKVVNTKDMTRTMMLRDQSRPVKHLSFDPSGSFLAVSCSDGILYVYSLSTEEPKLLKKVDGLIRSLETDAEASSKAVWHPDGRAFAVPTATREIQVMSKSDWKNQRSFVNGHDGDITALAWSPNGALLASAGMDRKVLLWETKTQKIVSKYDYPNVMGLSWHPTENILSFTNSDGELYIYTDFVPADQISLLKKSLQPSPFFHDPLSDRSANPRSLTNGSKARNEPGRDKRGYPETFDDIMAMDDDEDDFIIDDDGAGYVSETNANGKRGNGHLDSHDANRSKRRPDYNSWNPVVHDSFQPGSTPWQGNRKYMCLNLIGFVWTIDQDTHNTVTVEFYDREFHRDFHFTDPYLYDKACLNDQGTLFSCPAANGNASMVFYRPHETWTARADWRTELPAGEEVTSISLSDSYVVVTTSSNYVRIYTLYGTPLRIHRQKSTPTVTCASWRDYVLTMGNGPVGADGVATLTYTIENIKRDEICQSEDIVALPPGVEVKNVFFSDQGDPHIYDSSGVLLVLLHWRTPGQARWAPLLDTTQLARLSSGLKQETYWPVAVAHQKFHCIILKGADPHPYFPRPLLSEFELRVPVSAAPDSDAAKLEEALVRHALGAGLLEDLVGATRASAEMRSALARQEVELDKTLLQLLALECRESEERGMKAVEIVKLMRDASGRMLEAAGKVAARYGRGVLEEKIREIAEERLLGGQEEE
ncbi:MAG: hypothetical protein M1829_000027 [Trizodia sp. TS-e1964]|nr:MAG: hypothetical protein M1829_000027 [Trizodia sp. TS-e1964]